MQPGKARFPDRDKDSLRYLSLYHSYPEWIVRRWLERLGIDETETLLKAGNVRPPVSFRVLESRISISEAARLLSRDGIEFEKGEYLPGYIKGENAGRILRHDLFINGSLTVQDESQGLPVSLLDPPPGSRVLDLCAAPGGKTLALADLVGDDGIVTAVDISVERMKLIRENIERTGFGNIELSEIDILEYRPDGKFDYVLLDVPCSGLGTIASNPDLRWTKSEKDIMILSDAQKSLLRKASEFVADGGILVYSTCTTEPEEIEEVIFEFSNKIDGFVLEDGNHDFLEPFKTGTGIYRSWPHKHGIGGGGFARLRRSG